MQEREYGPLSEGKPTRRLGSVSKLSVTEIDPFLPSITRAGCNAASAHCYLRSTERLPENPAASRAEGQSARFCCSRRASSRKHSVNRWAGGLSARPLKVTIATGPKVVGISIGRIFKGR